MLWQAIINPKKGTVSDIQKLISAYRSNGIDLVEIGTCNFFGSHDEKLMDDQLILKFNSSEEMFNAVVEANSATVRELEGFKTIVC